MKAAANTEEPISSPDKIERLAFQFCKIATFTLLFGRFALPLAAALAAVLFIAAYVRGVRWTQCYLRMPLVVAGAWLLVLGIWIVREFHHS